MVQLSQENAIEDITHALPDLIATHIAAHNRPDPDAFIATFAADALLNDAQREFVGHDAIRAWADKEIFGDHVTMQVEKAYRNHVNIVVHARVDGDFDKSNLPDPVILSYYFSVDAGKIAQLIILLNKSVWQK
ncbi:SnoaL-like protein [Paraburkholderia silvatlantica]|uniref:SnoaL-like protein n=1 Tax=Paraburkholderia silvatlantica TaxID=321895 RepID=A0A2V4TVW3_9BURK|nr:nuclear transport factor 2 family protein [Paraburkholderia silvatlantica]PYE25458.1 SnoaL-like protein [Paraburkholderia silvatlantica]